MGFADPSSGAPEEGSMFTMRQRIRSRPARVLGATLVAAVLGGCATKSDIRDLQTEVREELRALAARQDSLIQQLRYQTSSTQDTLRTQSDQLFDFRGEITRQLQSIGQVLTRLEAIAGENQRGIASLRSGMGQGGGPVTTRPSTGPTPRTGPETVAGAGGGADQLYRTAREQDQRGQLGTAQRAYEQFLRQSPNHELAPDALFYLADVLERQDRPEDALERFLEIPARHPTSERVPDALYRAALLQQELGNAEEARATAQRIVNTYPDDPVAALARSIVEAND